MMGHNIHFKGGIWKIISKLSFLPLLIWNTDRSYRLKEIENCKNVITSQSLAYWKLCDFLFVVEASECIKIIE